MPRGASGLALRGTVVGAGNRGTAEQSGNFVQSGLVETRLLPDQPVVFVQNKQGRNRNDVETPRELEVRVALHRKSNFHLLYEFSGGELAILRNASNPGSGLGQGVEI